MSHKEILSESYDWLLNVLTCQRRWLSNDDLWIAFPYKNKLTREGLDTLIKEMKSATNVETDNTNAC